MPSTNKSSKTHKLSQRRLVFDDDKDKSTRENVAGVPSSQLEIQPPSQASPARNKRATSTSFESPVTKKTKPAAVTPEEVEGEKLAKYIPKYVHKNLEYKRMGEAEVPESTIKAFKWICERYNIPQDFEQKRSYGPLSGTTYEERVIQAYTLGKLDRSESAPDTETSICTLCAEAGHKRVDCPTLI